MVWGMSMPTSFGSFFPDGSYVGWRDDLEEYFTNKMPIEQKILFENGPSYPYHVISKFAADPGRQTANRPPSTSISVHEPPKRFVTENSQMPLGSFFTTENQILVVNNSLKKIIERFEPEAHRFFPLEIPMGQIKSSEAQPAGFFILVIGQHIDSFLPKQSAPNSWRYSDPDSSKSSDSDQTFFFGRDKGSMSGLALSNQVFGAAHLWRERRMVTPLICFSDTLKAEIVQAGLRLPKHYRLREI